MWRWWALLANNTLAQHQQQGSLNVVVVNKHPHMWELLVFRTRHCSQWRWCKVETGRSDPYGLFFSSRWSHERHKRKEWCWWLVVWCCCSSARCNSVTSQRWNLLDEARSWWQTNTLPNVKHSSVLRSSSTVFLLWSCSQWNMITWTHSWWSHWMLGKWWEVSYSQIDDTLFSQMTHFDGPVSRQWAQILKWNLSFLPILSFYLTVPAVRVIGVKMPRQKLLHTVCQQPSRHPTGPSPRGLQKGTRPCCSKHQFIHLFTTMQTFLVHFVLLPNTFFDMLQSLIKL